MTKIEEEITDGYILDHARRTIEALIEGIISVSPKLDEENRLKTRKVLFSMEIAMFHIKLASKEMSKIELTK